MTERVVLQRMRNRAIEAVQLLAEGGAGVRLVGADEWINQFFDIVDDDSPGQWRAWSVWTRFCLMLVGRHLRSSTMTSSSRPAGRPRSRRLRELLRPFFEPEVDSARTPTRLVPRRASAA